MAILAGFALFGGLIGRKVPSSFVPDEDQGYFFLNVQLPDAASLQRTDAVARKVERILDQTPGVRLVQHCRRLQPAVVCLGDVQRLLLRFAEAVGRAHRAGARTQER